MRGTLTVVLSLAAILFLAPLAVAPVQGYRETGTTSTAAAAVGPTLLGDPAYLHRAGFDVQPLDEHDEDDEGDDEDGADDEEEGEDDEEYVGVCHVPPGNPAAAHMIWIGEAAVPAHMAIHGDAMDLCDGDDEDEDDEDGDDDDEGEDGDEDDGDGETVQPSIVLTLSATSIEEGQSVLASWTVTNFVLDGAAIGSAQNVPGRGHVHVLVDGQLVAQTADSSLELEGLGVGSHTIRVELRNNDHSALSPAAFDEATVSVTAGATAATVGADPSWLFWLLAILLAMIAAAGAVLYRRRRHKPGP